jgi:hypothetical protein
MATDRPAYARLSTVAPAGLSAASYTTSRGTTPLRQTLVVAARRPAAAHPSVVRPSHTSLAEIVRLRGVPINRAAGGRCVAPGVLA